MIINAIKFRTTDDNQPKVWRFNQSAKDLGSFQCFFAKPQELKQFRQAIAYALTGQIQPDIADATIQVTRNDTEDTWIVERQPNNIRMIKNGVLMPNSNVSDTLLGAFFDLDEGFGPDEFQFPTFNLKYEDQELICLPAKLDHPGPKWISEHIEAQSTSLKLNIAKLFQQPMLDDDRVLHTLMKSAKKLWESYREQTRQHRTLLAKGGSDHLPAQSELDRIEEEIEIMQKVSMVLQPLIDPSQSPKVIKEKLSKTEEEYAHALKECQLTDTSSQSADGIPWEKLLNTLTRLVAYQGLVDASDKMLKIVEQKCSRISSDYISTLESLITSDNHIISELESCLSTLSIQFEDIAEPKQGGLSELVSKFIKPSSAEDPEVRKGRLENARMAIDYVLARLGELHGSIQSAKEGNELASDKLRERHEAFVAEYGKLSKLWHRQIEENGLPQGLTIKQLMTIIANHGRIAALKQSRSSLRQVLQNRRTDLQKLEEAVREWRKVTESQKESPLDNASLLIAEAQGIVRYLPKKKEALIKYRDQLEQQRSYAAIRDSIGKHKRELELNWSKLFNELGIPMIAIDRREWEEAFACGQQYLAWEMMRNQARKPTRGGDIFSAATVDAPMSFFNCLAVETSNSQRLTLLQAIENNSAANLHILMTADPNLRDMLAKLGVSASRLVVAEELRRKAAEPSTSRAQQILDLLNQK